MLAHIRALPGCDGLEALRRIRALDAQVRVVLITGAARGIGAELTQQPLRGDVHERRRDHRVLRVPAPEHRQPLLPQPVVVEQAVLPRDHEPGEADHRGDLPGHVPGQ